MSFEPLALYTLQGQFIGYTIKDPAVSKLQTTNIYVEGEEAKLNARIAELNENGDLAAVWPHPQDPEVRQLLSDREFCPINYVDREVVDDDNSFYVWKQEPETDEHGNYVIDIMTGQPKMVQGSELDEQASVIRYKIASVPEKPTDEMFRIKKACEVVARKRAGLLS
jgi:hypothetical protein